jgi:hypothetical protein
MFPNRLKLKYESQKDSTLRLQRLRLSLKHALCCSGVPSNPHTKLDNVLITFLWNTWSLPFKLREERVVLHLGLFRLSTSGTWRRDSFKDRCFSGTHRLHHQGENISELGTILAVTGNCSTLRRNTFVWTVGSYKRHTASHHRMRHSS